MKAAALPFMLSLAFLAAQTNAWARDAVLPAGTLVQCTLDEPNFSTATASVEDPVLCYPHGLYSFGQVIFPRGSYIVGHLADEKEPGHFWGKGELHLEFDRIGLPSGDVPLAAKLISVSGGYRVDKEGKIIGKGHAKRDTIEWLFPPLWPWKIITLPMKGPRPTLKGETRVTLRLMEDVLVPDAAQYRRFGQLDYGTIYAHPAMYVKAPQKLTVPSALQEPQIRTISWQPQAAPAINQADPRGDAAIASDNSGWHKFGRSSAYGAAPAPGVSAAPNVAAADEDTPVTTAPPTDKIVVPGRSITAPDTTVSADDLPVSAPTPQITTVPATAGVIANTPVAAANSAPPADIPGVAKTSSPENAAAAAGPEAQAPKPKLTLFAMQAGTVYAVTDYWRDEDRLAYVLANGKEGQVEMSQLDWKTTSQLNGERNVKVTLRDGR